MAAVIADQLSGEFLRDFWNKLGKLEQLAVREAAYDPLGEVDWVRFRAKYGSIPKRSKKYGAPPSHLEFFLYSCGHSTAISLVPDDLKARLLKFVEQPPEVKLAIEPELPEYVEQRESRYVPPGQEPKFLQVPIVVRVMDQVALKDLTTMLKLLENGKISVSDKTRRPSLATIKTISNNLDGGDFFEPDQEKYYIGKGVGAIRAFAWPMLLQAGKLVQLNGSKLAVTKAGRDTFKAPLEDTIRNLWNKWINSTIIDEFSRIDVISGQTRGKGRRAMTAASGRRPVVSEALGQCPVDQWVRFDEFSRFMQADGYGFEITRNPWLLYISDAEYGSLGYSGHDEWHILQGRYIRCLLFEYAATLGLIDVAYVHPDNARDDFHGFWAAEEMRFLSRYDGLEYFRLNPLGAYCLGLADKYESKLSLDTTPVQVFSDLRICAEKPLSTQESLLLETWANVEAEGVWRLDRTKSVIAVENGQGIGDLRLFLEDRDQQPLPEKVEGFLRSVERNGQALGEQGRALLVECATEEIAAMLSSDKKISKLCLLAGKKHLAVKESSEANFRKAIRDLGFGMPRK
ncbi:MAG: hypothetical protein F4X92_08900 [Gammaproteobacteria bacterium]|nr:hypothetical protein [Gammaproteobacteria bacterium]